MTERDVAWALLVPCAVLGMQLLVFARWSTERSRRRADRARVLLVGRLRPLRPLVVGGPLTVARTRLAGVGLLLVAAVALWVRLR